MPLVAIPNFKILAASSTPGQPIPYSGKSTLLYTLNNPNAYGTVGYDYFGYSVGMDDNYAIVGAYREGDASGTQSGKAYIFDGDYWTTQMDFK